MKTAYRYFKNIFAALSIALVFTFVTSCGLVDLNVKDEQATKEKSVAANPNDAASIDTPLVSANDSLLAMMRYGQFIRKLDKQQLNEEFKRINDAYFIRPNDRSALKRAMLLMRPDADFYDKIQAKQLVNDIINKEDVNVPVFKDYAIFLLSIIEMQEGADQRYNELQKEFEVEVSKRKKTEEQLEALKSIEESISQRKK